MKGFNFPIYDMVGEFTNEKGVFNVSGETGRMIFAPSEWSNNETAWVLSFECVDLNGNELLASVCNVAHSDKVMPLNSTIWHKKNGRRNRFHVTAYDPKHDMKVNVMFLEDEAGKVEIVAEIDEGNRPMAQGISNHRRKAIISGKTDRALGCYIHNMTA